VKGVEHGDLDQGSRPDHGSGVDKVTAKDTGYIIAQHLGGQDQEQVGKETEVLAIDDLLDDADIHGVSGTTSTVGGQCEQDVLLGVERSGIEKTGREDVSQELAKGVRDGVERVMK
jgi:hypothetical protein